MKKVKIVNLTPHEVTVFLDEDKRVFKTSGKVARLPSKTIKVGWLKGIPLTNTSFFKSEIDLPPQKRDTYYIVSRMVLNAKPNRKDLLVPSGIIRNAKGKITGCTHFDKN